MLRLIKIFYCLGIILFPSITWSSTLYTYSFNSSADQIDPESGSGSAALYGSNPNSTTTYNASGAWDNGAYLRVQLNNSASEVGAGIYVPLDQLNLTGKMSVGWVSRMGSNFLNLINNSKMAMMRVGDGSDAIHNEGPQMIVNPAHTPTAYYVPQISSMPSNGGRQDEFGRDYPTDYSDNHSFKFDDYENQWVYYEITNDPVAGTVELHVFTQDGLIASTPLADTVSLTDPSRELHSFGFAAYLHEITGADSNSFADISDLYVGDDFMGPPAGFIPAPALVYSYSFDSAADQTDPEGSGGSAELYANKNKTAVTYQSSGAWDNGSYLRVSLLDNTVENDAGIFLFLDQLEITGKMSVGWISRMGSNFSNLIDLNKMTMMLVSDGTTSMHDEGPQMIITPAHSPTAYYVPQISAAPSNYGRQDELGRAYPMDYSDSHSFNFDDYEGEWVYYEIINDPAQDTVQLSVYTRDGAIGTVSLASTFSETMIGRELYAFRFVAYLWSISGVDSNSYADISDVFVGTDAMGPPSGFVSP